MQNEFWEKLYARLLEDYDFLALAVLDTSDNELIKLVKPNRALSLSCASLIKKGKITNKTAFAERFVAYAAKDAALRKIILFSWIENNQKTMAFLTLAVNQEVVKQLNQDEFGDEQKIRILAKIDLRHGLAKIFEDYFENKKQVKAQESIEAAIQAPKEGDSVIDIKHIEELEQQLVSLQASNAALREANKELRNEQEVRLKELSGLAERCNKQQDELTAGRALIEQLTTDLKGAEARLEFAKKELERVQTAPLEHSFDELELRSELSRQIDENRALKRAVENRDGSISRLEKEKAALVYSKNEKEEAEARVESLQARLQLAQKGQDRQFVVGHLIDGELFLGLHGEAYKLDRERVSTKGLVFEELCVLSLGEDGQPVGIESLEGAYKQELVGVVRSEQGEFYLEADGERFEIRVGLSARFVGRPARGIFLPEAGARAEGIYRVDDLDARAQTEAVVRPMRREKSGERLVERVFDGEHVLIVGGDWVGHDYERALEPYGLQVSWRSGFEGFKELRGGLAAYEAVVVIVKQLSHAVLRELVVAAKREGVALLYCSRRGVSGVLKCLEGLKK